MKITRAIRARHTCLMDSSAKMVSICSRTTTVEVVQARIEDYQSDARFGVITCLWRHIAPVWTDTARLYADALLRLFLQLQDRLDLDGDIAGERLHSDGATGGSP